MLRDQLIRKRRRLARKRGLEIEVDKTLGKGSHYWVRFGGRVTTVQDGDLSPMHIRRICEQVGIDPAEL